MLLQIMTLSLNIRLYGLPIRQRDLCDFPLGRIGFFRLSYKNLVHHSLFKGVILKEGSSGALLDLRDFTADCLVKGQESWRGCVEERYWVPKGKERVREGVVP